MNICLETDWQVKMEAFCSAVVVNTGAVMLKDNTRKIPCGQLSLRTTSYFCYLATPTLSKSSLHNTNWPEVCAHLCRARMCVRVCTRVITARGAEASGLCVRGWALFIAVSQVGVKAWAWSSPASSICRRGRSHLSSAEQSEHRDGSDLPLEMTGLCANGPRAGGGGGCLEGHLPTAVNRTSPRGRTEGTRG